MDSVLIIELMNAGKLPKEGPAELKDADVGGFTKWSPTISAVLAGVMIGNRPS